MALYAGPKPVLAGSLLKRCHIRETTAIINQNLPMAAMPEAESPQRKLELSQLQHPTQGRVSEIKESFPVKY